MKRTFEQINRGLVLCALRGHEFRYVGPRWQLGPSWECQRCGKRSWHNTSAQKEDK